MNRASNFVAAAFVLLAAGVAAASSGVAVDAQGDPIEGVKVCVESGGVQQLCALTDEEGRWSLPPRGVERVVLTHRDYLPRSIGGGEQPEPVALELGAALAVRLENVEGEPLEEGHVDVLLPSGKRFGPFPIVNEAGTKIHSLDPGPVEILARAKGYAEKRVEKQDLPAGETTVVVLRLEPKKDSQ